jgi:hypothetical protein
MKIIISERQYKIVSEQPITLAPPGGYDYQRPDVIRKSFEQTGLSPHEILTIHQIGTSFVPVIGPLISIGIGLADAKLYWDEGDKKTAGLVGLFSAIPLVGGLAVKIGLSGWGSKALAEIGKKLSFGTKLSQVEEEVVKKVAQYRKLIEDGMKKLGQDASIRAGKELAKKQLKKQAVVQGAKNLGKDAAVYTAAGVGYSKGYDIVRGGTPKVKTSVEGFDWDFVKSAFGSSGNKKDNELLNLAWDKGWRPDKPVPVEFQTDTYKSRPDNLKGLQDLLASIKEN